MRINKFVATCSGLSRRAADEVIVHNRVTVNGQTVTSGYDVQPADTVELDGRLLQLPRTQTIILNKPVGYVTSRDGQGSKTIYDLLPEEFHQLKPVGRLDKNSSGLLLLTNDGDLAQRLTHPRYQKTKVYEIRLDAPLQPLHRQMISDIGIQLEDGPSKLFLERLEQPSTLETAAQETGRSASGASTSPDTAWRVTMHEGRNRQIRRTFEALGYQVIALHRTHFGAYQLGTLQSGAYRPILTL